MKEMYSNVTKVLVESRQGSNMLYLPLDKIMQMNGVNAAEPTAAPATAANDSAGPSSNSVPVAPGIDSRGRDNRQRDRDLR
jgi:membrane protease subunit HflK